MAMLWHLRIVCYILWENFSCWKSLWGKGTFDPFLFGWTPVVVSGCGLRWHMEVQWASRVCQCWGYYYDKALTSLLWHHVLVDLVLRYVIFFPHPKLVGKMFSLLHFQWPTFSYLFSHSQTRGLICEVSVSLVVSISLVEVLVSKD